MAPQVTTQTINRSKTEMDQYRLEDANNVFTLDNEIYATFRFYNEDDDTVRWLTIKFS